MILVTGATGQVGSEVIKQLAAKGVKPRALVRNPQKAQMLSTLDVDIAQGDYEDVESLNKAMQGIDHVFLLSPSGPEQVRRETNVVETAKRSGVEHIVKLSVIGASPFSTVKLEQWHWHSEKIIEESGIGFTHVRPTLFMQNLFAYSQSIASEGKFYASMGDAKVSLIDVRDIASVAATVLTEAGHMGRIYEITGPEAVSYSHIAETMTEALGKTVTYIDVPPDAVREPMRQAGMPDWLVEDVITYSNFAKEGWGSLVTHNVGKVTGRQPTMLEAFVCDYADVFRRGLAAAA